MLYGKQLFISLLFAGSLSAQRVIDVDANDNPTQLKTVGGTVILSDKYVRVVEGSPFFKVQYLKSNLVHAASKNPVIIKINLLTNEIYYKDEQDQELIAVSQIKKLTLTDSNTSAKYTFINSSFLNTIDKLTAGWYQQLDTGKVQLYKFHMKSISETLPYGQATTEQRIYTFPVYYLYKNNNLNQVKKLEDLQELLSDKLKEVSAYMKANNIKKSGEPAFISIVRMYNDLGK